MLCVLTQPINILLVNPRRSFVCRVPSKLSVRVLRVCATNNKSHALLCAHTSAQIYKARDTPTHIYLAGVRSMAHASRAL